MNDLVKKDQDQGGLIPYLVGKESGLVLPKSFERDVYLFDGHVVGASYVEGIKEIEASLQEGDHLVSYREPENSHDSQVIRIETVRKEKIGYAPRQDNAIFSQLMGAGEVLFAKIMEGEMKGTWLKIKVKIYLHES